MMEHRKRKQYDQGENRLRQFLSTVPQKTKSDMVIATGDLVDFFEAETTGGNMLDIQAEQFSRLLNDYDVPVLLTLGNHDVFSFRWRNDSLKHNQNSTERSRAIWNRNESLFQNGTYYSRLYQVGQTLYRFIFLDDSFYMFLRGDSTGVPYIDKPQLYWLRTQLNESKNDKEIIFMHIPLSGNVHQQVPTNELYSLLAENPSIKLIFAGHHHRNDISVFPAAGDNKLVQVQTGALVQNPEDWRLIRLTEKNVLVSAPGTTGTEMVVPIK
jgi:3',5'-cyclic AMP phosphodiesterase CpdA